MNRRYLDPGGSPQGYHQTAGNLGRNGLAGKATFGRRVHYRITADGLRTAGSRTRW